MPLDKDTSFTPSENLKKNRGIPFEKSILNDLRVGDRFITPYSNLDNSKERVKFTSTGVSKK